MQLARVTGTVVATQKHEKLVGVKLLLVQPMSADGGNNGSALLAVDAVQAGVGDRVLVVLEGRAAISVVQRRYAPVDAAVVGVVDTLMFESEDDRART
jgi:microcompartment protein CcmK/EutM